MSTPSEFDNEMFYIARNHINDFVKKTAEYLQFNGVEGKILEIGPQEQSIVKESFYKFKYSSLDLVKTYNPTYVGDITKYNSQIYSSEFDCIACMEVLEHTLNPFDAVQELWRMLRHDGYILFSSPLNWRIHGPIPDCWRFTEHGWRVLLKDFDIIKIETLETPNRELFPVKYNILAKCNKYKRDTPVETLNFRYI